ncbi:MULTISPECIES: hypothetical protein [Streptomyces]|uniref:Thiopeptide-type bacteriocin biosynthesis domain-containing protein n=1 Tax=Streptomyces parvus TaxID=66428 RepID=A0A5D4JMU5_9ACTN|nr:MULTISPECIES: hypothetical protein [Streptomyces]PVD02896.1 hypothetical protein DBP12_05720 [Streptomyces sp. CS014]TYR66408.1 hypothetical protein FY004_01015 [Streptomyces parvus]
MTRDWLFCHLSGAGPRDLCGLLRSVPELRSPDTGTLWFFDRSRTGSGAHGLDLWFHSAPGTLREIGRLLGSGAVLPTAVAVVEYRDRPMNHPGTRGFDLADQLADVSSRLAVGLAEGAPPSGDPLDLAVLHLRHLVGLVAERDRSAFLFHCWQHWTAALEPAHRVDLGLRAELAAGPGPHATIGPGPDAPAAWQEYVRATQGLTSALAGAAEANFLLFDHARRTHVRLAIPVSVAALAARVVRAELSGSPIAGPVAPAAPAHSGSTLQSA